MIHYFKIIWKYFSLKLNSKLPIDFERVNHSGFEYKSIYYPNISQILNFPPISEAVNFKYCFWWAHKRWQQWRLVPHFFV